MEMLTREMEMESIQIIVDLVKIISERVIKIASPHSNDLDFVVCSLVDIIDSIFPQFFSRYRFSSSLWYGIDFSPNLFPF